VKASEAQPIDRPLLLQVGMFILTRLVINTAHRMVYSYLPFFTAGLGVPLEKLATALSARSAMGALGPFLATVADTRGRKAGMLFGLSLFTVAMAITTLWPTFPAFVVTLSLAVVGYLVFIPSMQAYLGDRVAYRQRGLVLSLTELSWSLSLILGLPVAGILIARWGWQRPYPVLLGLAVIALLLMARLLPADPPRPERPPAWWHNFSLLLASPMALCGLGMGITFSLGNELINLVFSVWLVDSFGFTLQMMAQISVAIGVMELVGETLAALLSDRLGKIRSVAGGLLLGVLAALGLAFFARSLLPALAGLLVFYLAFEFALVSSMPLMSEVLPASRATLLATNIALLSLGRALGDLVAPTLYAWGKTSLAPLGLTPVSANALGALALNLLALLLLFALRPVER